MTKATHRVVVTVDEVIRDSEGNDCGGATVGASVAYAFVGTPTQAQADGLASQVAGHMTALCEALTEEEPWHEEEAEDKTG